MCHCFSLVYSNFTQIVLSFWEPQNHMTTAIFIGLNDFNVFILVFILSQKFVKHEWVNYIKLILSYTIYLLGIIWVVEGSLIILWWCIICIINLSLYRWMNLLNSEIVFRTPSSMLPPLRKSSFWTWPLALIGSLRILGY